jgi:hypothetical protein
MTATLDDVTKKKIKAEPTAEERVAEELVRRAREQGHQDASPARAASRPAKSSPQGPQARRCAAMPG